MSKPAKKSPAKIILHTDGASRGNPGEAAAGYIATLNGQEILRGSKYLDKKTNNEAEYLALHLALTDLLAQKHHACEIHVHADSELMIRQLQGKYKVKAEGLQNIFFATKSLLEKFAGYQLTHVPREQNRTADQLANHAIDNKN